MLNNTFGNGVSSRICINSNSFFIQLVIFSFILSTYNAQGDELHIGGIFPIAGKGGWQGGQACMPAARLALEDVNRKTDLLPGFNLTLHFNDSEVSRKNVQILINFIQNIFVELFCKVFSQ